MPTNVLAELEPDDTTAKRAQYEAFEFALEAPGIVRVTNGSHADPEDHTYCVNVESDIPVACECPADVYREGACKHRVAVAIRQPVLRAATTEDGPQSESSQVIADGGKFTVVGDGDDPHEGNEDDVTRDSELNDCTCHLLPGEYPCVRCYVGEVSEWPSETRRNGPPEGL